MMKDKLEWSAEDFSAPDLREAWVAYKKALQFLEDPNKIQQSPYVLSLIQKHKERVYFLEQAQRVINYHRATSGDYFK